MALDDRVAHSGGSALIWHLAVEVKAAGPDLTAAFAF